MEIRVRNTGKVVQLRLGDSGGLVPARIWQGETSTGIPVHMYVTRIAVAADRPAHELAQFETELEETEVPRPDIEALPLRLIL